MKQLITGFGHARYDLERTCIYIKDKIRKVFYMYNTIKHINYNTLYYIIVIVQDWEILFVMSLPFSLFFFR